MGVSKVLRVPAGCREQHPEVSEMEMPTLAWHPRREPWEGLAESPSRGKQ